MANDKARQGSEKRQRKGLIATRVDDAERAALRAAAQAAGLDVAAYVRRQVFGTPGPRTHRRFSPDQAALAKLRGELGYVGNNLNQLTRAVNMGDLESPRELDATLTRLLALLDQITEAMGQRAGGGDPSDRATP